MTNISTQIKQFYHLTKPGIVYGNSLSVTAGYFFGSLNSAHFYTYLAVLVGAALIIGSACVANNYIDQDIDRLMTRTKNRAVVTGAVSGAQALIFSGVLIALGSFILLNYTNFLTFYIGIAGWFWYVIIYGLAKRKTPHSTLVGSVCGATPPVIGYAAAVNRLDITAALLFLILVFWQMPHFYAIAIFRMKEYAAAKIPVLPIKKGVRATKSQMIVYMVAFTLAAASLHFLSYGGWLYLIIVLGLGTYWLNLGIKGWQTKDSTAWARKVFGASLIILLVFCTTISLEAILP